MSRRAVLLKTSNALRDSSRPPQHQVEAKMFQDILVERYWFSPHADVTLPKHGHAEYQFGLALTDPGEYLYRGAYHPVPVGSLSIIHPSETHSGCGFGPRASPTVFHSIYVPGEYIGDLIGEMQDRRTAVFPFVPTPVLTDTPLAGCFHSLFELLRKPGPVLTQEAALQSCLRRLFTTHGGVGPQRDMPMLPRAVRTVREYLEAHVLQEVSLKTLATVADLSAYHLTRAFTKAVGIPPHRYQLHRRLDYARRLLAQGWPPAHVAAYTGFAQQSHFGAHFRRLVNTSPGSYKTMNSKSLIDKP